MRKKVRKCDGIQRMVIAGIAVLAQLFLLIGFVGLLRQYAIYVYVLLEIAGVIAVIALINRSTVSAYTIAWLLIILLLPVFGYVLYLLWGRSGSSSPKSREILKVLSMRNKWVAQDEKVVRELRQRHPELKKVSAYLLTEGFPLYRNTVSRYYPLGELQFEEMIADMKNARCFIFLEYFIVSEGKLWDRIHQVLRKKAAQGVEVRLLYDDFGSILTLPDNFMQTLTQENIKVQCFNPVHKYLSRLYLNYRNHQKIAVIDGQIGYVGGANLADEYANLYEKYGHWKDAGVRLVGDAVWSLTVNFLQMWLVESNKAEDFDRFRPETEITGDGFYQPFSDGPVNHPHNPAQAGYRQIIYSAQEYVYITTPYLVIDNNMMDALCMAAVSGVDVRIITPKVWDRWYVHMVTRSNYGRLLKAGVRIFEYTPGYMHAKTIISDGKHAITGSINMDYRSFYLHFENGIWICGAPILQEIKKDLDDTFAVSEEIFWDDWEQRPWYIKLVQVFLRLFIPLL